MLSGSARTLFFSRKVLQLHCFLILPFSSILVLKMKHVLVVQPLCVSLA